MGMLGGVGTRSSQQMQINARQCMFLLTCPEKFTESSEWFDVTYSQVAGLALYAQQCMMANSTRGGYCGKLDSKTSAANPEKTQRAWYKHYQTQSVSNCHSYSILCLSMGQICDWQTGAQPIMVARGICTLSIYKSCC
jgi:hypothetical protein